MTWIAVPLQELCRPRQWRALPAKNLLDAGYPVYGANGVIGYYDTFTHRDPVIAVGCRGTIGSVHITRSESFVTSNSMALDELKDERVDLRFLARFLQFRGFKDVVSGSSQPQLTRQGISKVAVPLPPLDEQRRIAAILDQADAIRTKRRGVIERTVEVIDAKFSLEFPRSRYETRPLSELGAVLTGKTPPTSRGGMFGGEIPFVTPGDLEGETPAQRSVTNEGALLSKTVAAGSVLVCCIGTIGKTGIASETVAFNQQINAVEWSDSVDPVYGLYAVRQLKPLMRSQGDSTTLPILPKSRFGALEIPVPDMKVQREFSQFSSAVWVAAKSVRAALAQDDALFDSLQARAFKGEL